MDPLKHYYEILGVKPAATLQEINQAYINLLNQLHPYRLSKDPRLQQKAQAKAKEINNAYAEIKKAYGSRKGVQVSSEAYTTSNPPAEDKPQAPAPVKPAPVKPTSAKGSTDSITARKAAAKKPAPVTLTSLKLFRGLLFAVVSVSAVAVAIKVIIPKPAARQNALPPQQTRMSIVRPDTAPATQAVPTLPELPAPPTSASRRSTAAPTPAARRRVSSPPIAKKTARQTAAAKQAAERAALHAAEVRHGAEQGGTVAQGWLGYLYVTGEGVPQDYREAAAWYRKAAEQGHAGAQDWLGYLYETGKGVPQDFGEAALWYRRAAEQGDADAQKNLALLYAHGKGVAKNQREAIKWYRRAANQGNVEAQRALEIWTEQ